MREEKVVEQKKRTRKKMRETDKNLYQTWLFILFFFMLAIVNLKGVGCTLVKELTWRFLERKKKESSTKPPLLYYYRYEANNYVYK